MINPYDLGGILEQAPCLEINDLIHKAREEFKIQFIKSKISLNNQEISLMSTKTRFGGERLWFLCPKCHKRRGTLFKRNGELACRICLNLKYKKQRYSKMLELQV